MDITLNFQPVIWLIPLYPSKTISTQQWIVYKCNLPYDFIHFSSASDLVQNVKSFNMLKKANTINTCCWLMTDHKKNCRILGQKDVLSCMHFFCFFMKYFSLFTSSSKCTKSEKCWFFFSKDCHKMTIFLEFTKFLSALDMLATCLQQF